MFRPLIRSPVATPNKTSAMNYGRDIGGHEENIIQRNWFDLSGFPSHNWASFQMGYDFFDCREAQVASLGFLVYFPIDSADRVSINRVIACLDVMS
jgi:hypothetical protein